MFIGSVSVSLCLLMMLFSAAVLSEPSYAHIHDGGNDVVSVETPEKDYAAVLNGAGIDFNEYDSIKTEEDENGEFHIYIERAFDVDVTADGKTVSLKMTGGTVADALPLADVEVSDTDLINMSALQEVYPGAEIVINRVTTKEIIKDEAIAFRVVYVENDQVPEGEETVLNDGAYGVKSFKYIETSIDGVASGQEFVSVETTTEPVNKVIEIGTMVQKLNSGASILETPAGIVADSNGNPVEYEGVITGRAAAYSARAGAKTASGLPAIPGHVAVDPNIIPYGTELYIASTDGSYVYGYAIAADTGTALMEGLIVVDLFFSTNQECRQFGIKDVNIYVLN